MSDVDETLDLEEVSAGDRPLSIPDELPILPLRDTVLYPNSFMPLAVARESSVKLIDDAISAGKLVGVFTQRDAGVEEPQKSDLYEVGTVKAVRGRRTYVSVDGGMSDNIRPALYDASYSCTLASRTSDAPPMLARVVGKHCESGDVVVKDEFLPADIAPGDLLAVPGTGAYCRSMASNYNCVPRPPVVAARAGAVRTIVRRETVDDLLRLDVG